MLTCNGAKYHDQVRCFPCIILAYKRRKSFPSPPLTINVVTLSFTNDQLRHMIILSVHCYEDDIYRSEFLTSINNLAHDRLNYTCTLYKYSTVKG